MFPPNFGNQGEEIFVLELVKNKPKFPLMNIHLFTIISVK